MKNINTVLLMVFVLCFSGATIASQKLGHSNDKHTVEGYGEYLLAETESRAEGTKKAIDIAKIDAARRIGEYFEIITLTDANTGKVKNFIAGVSASKLQVEDVKTEFQLEGEDLTAIARVTLTYSESDMKASLDRFMENGEIKKALRDSSEKVKNLIEENKERTAQIESLKKLKQKLQSANTKSIERIEKLEEQITISRKSVMKYQDSVIKGIDELYASIGVFNKIASNTPVVNVGEHSDMQQKYKEFILALATSIENYTVVKMTNDAYRGKIDVDVMFSWDVTKEKIDALASEFGGEWSRSEFIRGTEAKIHTMKLKNQTLQSVYTKYAIFQVVEVGHKKVETPILVPVRAKSINQDIADVCESGVPLNQQGSGFFLCVASRFTRLSSVAGHGVLSRVYDISKTDEFSLPSDRQYEAKKYIEVREINGAPLKTIKF